MSERGVFAVDRGVFDHDKLREDNVQFSKIEAWLWLLSSAAWKPHRRRVSGHNFDLQRGQLVASTRYMAERWRWTEARVRRFLDLLKTDAGGDAMIDARSDAGVTVITIRKYDIYQRVSLPSDAPNDAATTPPSDAVPAQERRNKEDIQAKEEIVEVDSRAHAMKLSMNDDWPEDFRDQFWQRYPHKVGKPKALAKLDGIRKRAVLVPFDALMIGLDRYIRDKPPDRQWLNPETFLNQERWADQPAIITTNFGGFDAQTDNNRSSVHPLRSVPGKGGGFGRLRANLRAGQPPS